MSNTRGYYHLDFLSYFILVKNIAHSTKVKKEAREGNPEGGGVALVVGKEGGRAWTRPGPGPVQYYISHAFYSVKPVGNYIT